MSLTLLKLWTNFRQHSKRKLLLSCWPVDMSEMQVQVQVLISSCFFTWSAVGVWACLHPEGLSYSLSVASCSITPSNSLNQSRQRKEIGEREIAVTRINFHLYQCYRCALKHHLELITAIRIDPVLLGIVWRRSVLTSHEREPVTVKGNIKLRLACSVWLFRSVAWLPGNVFFFFHSFGRLLWRCFLSPSEEIEVSKSDC
jgi:hypothetical protein